MYVLILILQGFNLHQKLEKTSLFQISSRGYHILTYICALKGSRFLYRLIKKAGLGKLLTLLLQQTIITSCLIAYVQYHYISYTLYEETLSLIAFTSLLLQTVLWRLYYIFVKKVSDILLRKWIEFNMICILRIKLILHYYYFYRCIKRSFMIPWKNMADPTGWCG